MTRSVVRYSEAFKLKVVNELESGKFSGTDEARKSYGIKGPATVIFPFSISQSLDLCVYAHSKLIALKSVAFDLFITNEGPLIIEANFNWDIEMLYNHPHKNLRELLPEEWLKNKNNANTTLT